MGVNVGCVVPVFVACPHWGFFGLCSMLIVREAEVQKCMFTYHIEGQFNFMFILYPQLPSSIFLDVEF